MTQDQYGQTRGPGYVVRDGGVPDDENEEVETGQSKPMTRFQKVASALRGGDPERDEQDEAAQAANPQAPEAGPPWLTQQDDAAMAGSPISQQAQRQGDYWDEPAASAADRDQAVAVTNPDVPVPETGTDPLPRQDQVTGQTRPDAADHPATQPNMFSTTTHGGNGATSAPAPRPRPSRTSRPTASRPTGSRPTGSRPATSRPVRRPGLRDGTLLAPPLAPRPTPSRGPARRLGCWVTSAT